THAGPRPLALLGDEDFGSHLRVLDGDPASPTFLTLLGEWQTRPEVSIHNIMADADGNMIASHYQDGLRIVDLSDPSHPPQTAYSTTWRGPADPAAGFSFYDGAVGEDVVGRRIYVADTLRGLLILDRL